MTGLDKIINQILKEADDLAAAKIETAEKEAQETIAAAQKDAEKASEEISRRSEIEIRNYRERVTSADDLNRRRAILEAKQEMISEVIEKAYQRFCAQEKAEYFEVIKEMIRTFALAQEGDIYFSANDLDRMPQMFFAEIDRIAQEKGGKLKLSPESRAIDGGFILAYGGIEENCSLKALFDSRRDQFKDLVQTILFS